MSVSSLIFLSNSFISSIASSSIFKGSLLSSNFKGGFGRFGRFLGLFFFFYGYKISTFKGSFLGFGRFLGLFFYGYKFLFTWSSQLSIKFSLFSSNFNIPLPIYLGLISPAYS